MSKDSSAQSNPPTPDRREEVTDRHGHSLVDPYAWIRDPDWQRVMREPDALQQDIRDSWSIVDRAHGFWRKEVLETRRLRKLIERLEQQLTDLDPDVTPLCSPPRSPTPPLPPTPSPPEPGPADQECTCGLRASTDPGPQARESRRPPADQVLVSEHGAGFDRRGPIFAPTDQF